ncbi:MAG: hypothetical protein ACRDHI_09625 [Actinomycetota bacterium]
MKRLSRLSWVVVLGVLLVSAGGNVMAAVLITSADIKDNTIRSVDVRDATLKGADVKDGSIRTLDVANDSITGAHIANGAVGRAELASGAGPGCCVISFAEFTVPANSCHTRAISFPEANLGEIFLTFPESADLGAGVYMRPTVVAHPGEALIETCNSTGSPVQIPFGTFFQLRLVG